MKPALDLVRQVRPDRATTAGDLAFALSTLLMVAVGALSACRANAHAVPAEHEATPLQAVHADSKPPSNPLVGMTQARLDFPAVVRERIRAGGYAYLRLSPDDGERELWLATMGQGAEPGSHVLVRTYGSSNDFHSRRTGKTFEQLLFGEVEPDA